MLATLSLALVMQDTMKVTIPGSTVSFNMVRIPDNKGPKIWIATTEVTWDVYDMFAYRLDMSKEDQAKGVDVESRPSKPYGAPDRGFGHYGYAALGMTDNAANQFCKWLSKKTGKKFRIPTEQEWEHAARAGATELPSPLGDHAWFWENAEDQAQPVGKLKPNKWGIYDMLGNVAEWAIDAKGKAVTCGGSYLDKKVDFSTRAYYDPKWQEADAHVPKSKWWLSDGPFVGMRVVCED